MNCILPSSLLVVSAPVLKFIAATLLPFHTPYAPPSASSALDLFELNKNMIWYQYYHRIAQCYYNIIKKGKGFKIISNNDNSSLGWRDGTSKNWRVYHEDEIIYPKNTPLIINYKETNNNSVFVFGS